MYHTHDIEKKPLDRLDAASCGVPAPLLESLKQGYIPHTMLSIARAARAAGISLNEINSPQFAMALQQSPSPEIAAIASGYDSYFYRSLKSLRTAGVDLDSLCGEVAA
jgi:hypothetical protein